jgi:hypothetical protein
VGRIATLEQQLAEAREERNKAQSALLRCIAEIETLLTPTPKGLGDLRREYLAKLKWSALEAVKEGHQIINSIDDAAREAGRDR